MIYRLLALTFAGSFYLFGFIVWYFNATPAISADLPQNQAAPVINEVMASNSTTIQDRNGDYPDWLEQRCSILLLQ